jgi:ketosteroid isomerase-like protein
MEPSPVSVKEFGVPANPQKLYERYVWAGAMSHNPDAVAELFTADGVLESPLVPADHAYPRRMEGREAIRAGLAAYYERLANADRADQKVDVDRSRYVLHTTADPDVFIAEIDAAVHGSDPMSLVQIFRLRDGEIALMRDYFGPDQVV